MRRLRSSAAILSAASLTVAMFAAFPAAAEETHHPTHGEAEMGEVWTAETDLEAPEEGDAPPTEPWTPDRLSELYTETGGLDRSESEPHDQDAARSSIGALAVSGTINEGLGDNGQYEFLDFPHFDADGAVAVKVNIGNGNLFIESKEVTLAGPGVGVDVSRVYNSHNDINGDVSLYWSTNVYLLGLGIYSDGALFHGKTGEKIRFTGSGPTYAAPSGANATLVRNSDNTYTVTYNRTGERLNFNSAGWPTSNTDRNGVGVTYIYSGYDIIQVVSAATGRSASLDRYYGVVEAIRDSSGRNTSYSWARFPLFLTSAGGSLRGSTTYEWDYRTNLLSSVTSGGKTMLFEYDGRQVTKVTLRKAGEADIITTLRHEVGQTVVTDPNGGETTYDIDDGSRITRVTDQLGHSRSVTYTPNFDIASTTDATTNANEVTSSYDASNNLTGVQYPTGAAASAIYAVGADCSAPNTGTAFQMKCSTDDGGNKKQYEYDAAGNLLKRSDTTTSTPSIDFEYTYGTCGGFAGQICTSKDGNGNVTGYTYNASGDLTKVTPPAPMGATTYAYDSIGRVTSVTNGKGEKTSYAYNSQDRVLQTTFHNGQHVTSTYFPDGYENTRTDSAGGAITFTYDQRGRIKSQAGPQAGSTQTFNYDLAGNLLSFTDPTGTTEYAYDAANQLTKVRQPGGNCPTSGNPAANSGCILFEYDENGAETRRIMPGGANVVTAYDGSSRPTRITAKTGAGAAAVDIGFSYASSNGDDRFNVQSRTAHKEQGITAGAITNYAYDSKNRLTLAQEKVGASVTASWAYSYDNNGNRTKQSRTGTTGATAGTIDYGYNAANQLTSATGQSTSWTYDAAGNQTRNGLNGANTSYGVRGQATAFGTTTASYFDAGNTDRLSRGNITFTNGTLGTMQRTSGTTTHTYTRSPGGDPLGMRTNASYYYVADHLGSIVGLFSATGSWIGGYSYSPYGEARFTSTSSVITANALRYIGEHHDGAGIYKLGARYYDTAQGRFTQMDPSGQEANPYAYAGCNPVNSLDPSGLDACTAAAGIAGLLHGVLWSGAAGALFTGGTSVVVAGVVGLVIGGFWFAISEFGCSA